VGLQIISVMGPFRTLFITFFIYEVTQGNSYCNLETISPGNRNEPTSEDALISRNLTEAHFRATEDTMSNLY